MKKIIPIILTFLVTAILILILVILSAKPDTSNVKELTVGPRSSDHTYGAGEAKVVLIEYSDSECPACSSYNETDKQLKEEYKDKSVQFIYRHFPLNSIHQYAQKAAEATEAAAAQGKFWEMVDKLFENQNDLVREDLIKYAGELNLDVDRFVRELDDGIYRDKVLADYTSGAQAGVPGTPSVFINGIYYDGARSLGAMKEYIDGLLEGNR